MKLSLIADGSNRQGWHWLVVENEDLRRKVARPTSRSGTTG
jgi:nitroreductase